MKQNLIFALSAIFLFSVSCSTKEKKKEILHQLKPANYTDELIIDGTVEAVNSISVSCSDNSWGKVIYLAEEGKMVEKDEVVCILENKDIENSYQTLLQRLEQTTAEYTKSKADLDVQYAVLEAQVKANEAQSSITKLDSLQLLYASPLQRRITELKMKSSALEREKMKKKLGLLKTINGAELKRIQLQIARDSARADSYYTRIKNLTIKAPEAGMALRGWSPTRGGKLSEGDQAYSGIPIINLPNMSEMKVIILAPENDYKRIELNNKVVYTFNSMPGNTAYGKIKMKAPVGTPLNNNPKIKRFEITASIDSFDVIPEPGITANCQIILKTIADTIVVPQIAIFEEDSSRFVYIKYDKKFIRNEVMVAENSPKLAVVSNGLLGNELVSFAKPELSKISKTVMLPDSIKQKKSNLNQN